MLVTVLGAGMVGRAMAVDLSSDHSVTAVDRDESALALLEGKDGIRTVRADLAEPGTVEKAVQDCDIAVNAVPGFMGFGTLRRIILSGRNVVDIAFFPEDPSPLHDLALEHGVTAVTDMGVAPGMCNVILGRHDSSMEVASYLCLVGGLPTKRTWPWDYRAPFSPCDVIEEYVRPARFRENGADVVRPALSGTELVEFTQCGTLEAWNSDGLRSLLRTMPHIPDMKEKTLRWPGHVEKVRLLRDSGFFSREPLVVRGASVTPLEITERILFTPRNWMSGPEEDEFTVMRIDIKGLENGGQAGYRWELYDRFCPATGTSSMARTTGYACTAAVNLLAEGLWGAPGLNPPEYLGRNDQCFRFIMDYLERRNVIYRKESLEPSG